LDDNRGILFIADSGNNAVRVIALGAGPGDQQIFTLAQDPLLNTPFGVVYVPGQDKLYVTSFGGHNVFMFDIAKVVITNGVPEKLPVTLDNVYAGSRSGVFGHADGSLSGSIFMNPTGITADDEENLYINEWYILPGEVDMGSTWASENGVSTGVTVGSSKSSSASSGGGSKVGSMAGTQAGSKVGSSAVGSSKAAGTGTVAASAVGSGKTVGAGSGSGGMSNGKSASGSGGSSSSSSGSSSEDSLLDSVEPFGTSKLSSVNWGHEPQYLHNVRKVSTGSEQVSTIAGSIIRKS
jgi:hypothetical protein